jgi:hypothetical protein
MTRLKQALLFAAGGFVCLVLGLFVLTRPADRALLRATAPSGENLILFEGDRDFRGFPLSVGRRTYVYVGRDTTPTGYGHVTTFDLHPEMVDPALGAEAYAKRVTVTWSETGVTLEEPSGHRLFLPKRAYAGGR